MQSSRATWWVKCPSSPYTPGGHFAGVQLATYGRTDERLAHARAARAPSEYRYAGPARRGWLLRSATAAGAAVLLGGALLRATRRRTERARSERDRSPSQQAATSLHRAAALLAFSVMADSALEHYRARFEKPAMFLAPSVAAATLLTSQRAALDPQEASTTRSTVYATALATGLAGAAFHVQNVARKPGGFMASGKREHLSWLNLFYAAPLGAPVALAIAGALGLRAQRMARERTPSARGLALFVSMGLVGTAAEVALLHFRGGYQNPFMYVPLVVPPAAALALSQHALAPSATSKRTAEVLLKATAATGIAGVGFHAYGIQRNMGGFYNWSQMILQGPPLPAPPSFTGLAIAGLGALHLEDAP